jgi:hypothetical protein
MNYYLEGGSVTVRGLFVKLRRDLWLALDCVEECRSGDLGLVERNLIEGATAMLNAAAEVRATLRQ